MVDYEPPPVGVSAPGSTCPPPSPAALHRRTPRALRPAPRTDTRETLPPHAAAVFADTALRRVLEVIDRRRPIAQLRPVLSPTVVDSIVTLARERSGPADAAMLRRVRLRATAFEAGRPTAAEVFATYTRGARVRAIAARIECPRGANAWRLVALQVG